MIPIPKILLALISLIIVSCGQEKKEPPKEKPEAIYKDRERLDSLNKSEASKLSEQLGAITGKDSVLKFTYQLQEIFKKNNKPISFIGHIDDIIQKDSNFILKIEGRFSKLECNVEILISPEQFHEIYKQLDPKRYNEGCFIFKPTNIHSGSMLHYSSDLSLDYDAETVEEANENAESELTHSIDTELFFKGKLIDFYIYKLLKLDDN